VVSDVISSVDEYPVSDPASRFGVPVMQYQGYNGNNPQTVAYYRIK
jgi:hypothetical protein